MRGVGYNEHYEGWRAGPLAYWRRRARLVSWTAAPQRTFDAGSGRTGAGFPARLNASYNCLDRHMEAGADDRTALIWATDRRRRIAAHYRRRKSPAQVPLGQDPAAQHSRPDQRRYSRPPPTIEDPADLGWFRDIPDGTLTSAGPQLHEHISTSARLARSRRAGEHIPHGA